MKKFITIVMAFIALAVFSDIRLYAAGPKEMLLREKTKSYLKAPSTFRCISFCEKKKVTLENEIDDRLGYFSSGIDFDKSQFEFYDKMQSKYGGYEKELADAKKTYENTKSLVDYLASLKETLTKEELSNVTFVEYALTYEAANSFGVPIRNVCVGRFNREGKLVSIRLSETSDIHLFDNFFSIPKYYEMLGY